MKPHFLFKRTGLVGLVLWLSLGVFIDPAYPIESPWRVQGGLEPLRMGGTIQVREFDITGTKLDLADDLSMGRWTVLPFVEIAYYFLEKNALSLSFDYMKLSGDTTLKESINFNGKTFPSGVSIHSTSDLYHLQLLYRRFLKTWESGDYLSLLIGLDYTRLIFDVESETPIISQFGGPEDFKQSLPFPVLGLEGTYRLSRKTSIEGRFLGMKLNNLNTHQEEGGPLFQDETCLNSSLTAVYAFSHRFSLRANLTYRYFTQNLTSQEDGNFFHFSGIGILISAERRF
ncbi:MAG TPA: hypothetical protein VNM22_08860 [Candidatus Limnocylindrales bacterium]|nr:hypothetical protein [Candidatus Limnocylindrales bacterium]